MINQIQSHKFCLSYCFFIYKNNVLMLERINSCVLTHQSTMSILISNDTPSEGKTSSFAHIETFHIYMIYIQEVLRRNPKQVPTDKIYKYCSMNSV